jgi:hypothetical protein
VSAYRDVGLSAVKLADFCRTRYRPSLEPAYEALIAPDTVVEPLHRSEPAGDARVSV